MSKFIIGVAVVALISALAIPADAAQKGGGRGGGGGGGGGGGAHFSGGGGGGNFGRSSGSSHSMMRSSGYSMRSYSSGHIKSYSRGRIKSYAGGPTNRSFVKQNKSNNFAGNQGRLNSKKTAATQNLAGQKLVGQNGTGKGLQQNNKSLAVSKTLKSASVAGALQNKKALANPKVRNNIVANAAMAGKWKGNKGNNGWWRHRHGGFGWVGPLFWPFAFYDFYDYLWWDDYYAFWDYGYDDIVVGLISPYDYDDYAGYLPYRTYGMARSTRPVTQGSAVATAPQTEPSQIAQMCGDDTSDIAGLPVDRFRQAIQPNELQQAALDQLAYASAKAAQDIKAACPTEAGLTAPSRLALMEQRIEAMIGAVNTVQPPLETLYGLLNDEQKARLTALGNEQRQGRASGSLARSCGTAQSGTKGLPAAEIERSLSLNEAQRANLAELQNASTKAVEMLKTCPPDNLVTPPARLKAISERLETMLQAVKTVHAALDTFYSGLNDEQKARFEALGPQRTAQADASNDQDQPRVRRSHYRRQGGVNIYSILRRYGI